MAIPLTLCTVALGNLRKLHFVQSLGHLVRQFIKVVENCPAAVYVCLFVCLQVWRCTLGLVRTEAPTYSVLML